MRDQEKAIKERRTIEATHKRLMGASGKLGIIVQNLGEPIISQTQDMSVYDMLSSDDYDGSLKGGTPEEINNEIPTSAIFADDAETVLEPPTGHGWRDAPDMHISYTREIGWYFNGLSRGMNLEIKYIDLEKKLTVMYEGTCVYQEAFGELERYVPHEVWEDKIERLFKVAKDVAKQNRKIKKDTLVEDGKKAQKNWLQKMKEKWGFSI